MVTTEGQTKVSFGPFNLLVSERLLTKEGVPVELGARALDILIALISRPNEVLSKRDLMLRVWPDVIVEEGSLRFHMASLRKALGHIPASWPACPSAAAKARMCRISRFERLAALVPSAGTIAIVQQIRPHRSRVEDAVKAFCRQHFREGSP